MAQNYAKELVKTNFSRGEGVPPESASLDTLRITRDKSDIEPLNLTSQPLDKKALEKRARRKYIGQNLVPQLVECTTNEKQKRAYWQTYHCTGAIALYNDNTTSARYCKRRWCQVCAGMRTAQVINRLKPVFDAWQEPYFVTLTQGATVDAEQLRSTIDAMFANFERCKERAKKRHQRGKGGKFVGIRKIECTYNVRVNKYHPHFHVLVDGAGVAQSLVDDWLSLNAGANAQAQDCRQANSNSLQELAKYMTKLVATGGKGQRRMYADALNNIFEAFTGIRTIQTFGFKLPPEQESAGEASDEREVVAIADWVPQLADWANMETGELLSGYIPSAAIEAIVGGITKTPYYKRGGKHG